MEAKIYEAVRQVLAAKGSTSSFAVEWPADLSHGDYAVNAALVAAKELGVNPKALAEELAPLIKEALGEDVEKVVVAGPGFINLTLARSVISDAVLTASKEGSEWGKGNANLGRKVMVEYTDPNPFKEMHIGHLMSNVIGESVARLTSFSGANVAHAIYQGDIGPHVAKAIWGLQKSSNTEPATAAEIGKAYAQGSHAYEASEEAKAEIDALNVALYEGTDPALMELWRKGRAVSLEAFEEVYKTLGTKFDYYFFESEVSAMGSELVRDGIQKGVFEESQGAIIYPGEKKGLHTLVFITSRGTPTYEAKELGLAFLKEERWPSDLSVILTAAEQIGHFKVAVAALTELAPLLGGKTVHVPHGFLRLTSGKMSSREGNVVTAGSLVNDTIAKVSEHNDDPLVAEQVAIAAIKYSILKQSAGSDIIFDFDTSLSTEGDSGPYLQYAQVRAASILAQAGEKESTERPDAPYILERLLIRFPEVAAKAEAMRAPHVVAQYLTQLAGEWNSFYAKERIIGGEYEGYKLTLARAFVNTMQNGLWLLGISSPERM